jgi:hypothetical protein
MVDVIVEVELPRRGNSGLSSIFLDLAKLPYKLEPGATVAID